jgi:uncharacterized membrane protein YphA (DoxX/SURF4 family)
MLSWILSVLLGLFYLVSGVGKLLDVNSFSLSVSAFSIPEPLNNYAAILVPPLEIVLGVCLIFTVHNKKFAVASCAAIVVFTVSFAYAHFAHGVNSCGCFGVITALSSSPRWTFIRNGILLAISVFLVLRPAMFKRTSFAHWQLIILFLVTAVTFSASAISSKKPLYAPEPYLGKYIKNISLGSLVQTDPDSSYMIFCFAPNCPHCLNATENVKAYRTSGKVDRIIGLGYGSDSSLSVYKKKVSPNFGIQMFSNSALFGLFVGRGGVPKAYLIRRDTVIAVMSKEIPSPWTINVDMRSKGK